MYWQKSDKWKSGWRKSWWKRKAAGSWVLSTCQAFCMLAVGCSSAQSPVTGWLPSPLSQSPQVLLGTSWSVLLTPSRRTCSRPLSQLVAISFAPTLLLGSASKRGTFLLLLPSPCGCYRDTVPGRGPPARHSNRRNFISVSAALLHLLSPSCHRMVQVMDS